MVGKIFLVLCTLTLLRPVYPSHLTKEINADQSLEVKFRFIIDELEKTNILGEIITLASGNFEDIYANLTNLLESQSIPDISTVLDTINLSFGARLLYLHENNVQVYPSGIEELFTDNAKSLVKNVFPKDYLQQIVIFRALQKQIQSTVEKLRPQVENLKVSLDDINEKIALNEGAVQSRDLLSSLQTSVCNSLVNSAYSELNSSLSNITELLDSLTISSSDNGALSVLANIATYIINLIKQIISYVWEFAESIQSSICTTLLSSRKRRDLAFVEGIDDISKREIELAETGSVIATRSITVIVSVVWSILATILSYTLAALINRLIMSIASYLLGTFTTWLYSIIDSIF